MVVVVVEVVVVGGGGGVQHAEKKRCIMNVQCRYPLGNLIKP